MFYEMVADIYIILIAPKATNPFAGSPKLAKAKSYAHHSFLEHVAQLADSVKRRDSSL